MIGPELPDDFTADSQGTQLQPNIDAYRLLLAAAHKVNLEET
ncbi:MAG: hypothetical protein AAFZ92_01120 [Pseudomonadota bacterium]